MLKFTQLTDKLKYPLQCKSKLLLYHSAVITYVISKFDDYEKELTVSIKSILLVIIFRMATPISTLTSIPMAIQTNWSSKMVVLL